MVDALNAKEKAIFDILYEMRLAPRHQLEEAAKRVAALQTNNIVVEDVLALTRYAPTIDDSVPDGHPSMEVDNAMGRYINVLDIQALVTAADVCNLDSPTKKPPLTVQQFKEWLNDRRMWDVSRVFHEIVVKYREAVEYK